MQMLSRILDTKAMNWLRSPLSFSPHWLLWPFVAMGLWLVRDSYGVITLDWMYVYRIDEFQTWGDVGSFFAGLRTGISPVWSFLEIVLYWLGGNLEIPGNVMYRGGMVLVFAFSFMLFRGSNGRFIFSYLLALAFLWGTVLIHPGNPQVYDIYLPLLVLLFVGSLGRARKEGRTRRSQVAWLLAAGFFLSMAELTRPFIFPMLIVLLPLAWLSIRSLPKRSFLYFLLPIFLFSGSWHLKMLLYHGQLNWTNHTGYNLHRCWQDFAGFPPMEEDAPPRMEGLSPNIDTEVHYQNSKILAQATIKGIVRHPWGAVKHVAGRATTFFSPQVDLMRHKADHPFLAVYKWAVRLACLWMFWQGFLLLRMILGRIRDRRRWLALGHPENILLTMTLLTCLIFLVGDAGEDARFMVSVLPLLAALPRQTFDSQKKPAN